MEEKKQLVLNCEICDSTMMKEENYSHYEEIVINAEVLVANGTSKGVLGRLPVRLNIEHTIESDEPPEMKIINGAYEITAGMVPQKPVILVVNGSLKVCPGTEEALEKYKCMVINGAAEFPEGMKGSLDKMIVNGQLKTYPEDSVILEENFIMDSYFPIRAREGMKYFARNIVCIQDSDVDISKLLQKNVKMLTKCLVVPESRLEEGAMLVDANVDFVVVPEGLSLIYGDVVLDEELVCRKGGKLFVYGNLKFDEQADMELLQKKIDALEVTGSVTLYKNQREGFQKIHARYKELQVLSQERILHGMLEVRLNKKLFECSPDGICIDSAVKVVIEEDVTTEMLQNGLHRINCLRIECNDEQKDVLSIMGVAPGCMREMPEAGSEEPVSVMAAGNAPDVQKIINAECYVM